MSQHIYKKAYFNYKIVSVSIRIEVCPIWKQAVAWDLREMGSVRGKGVREGPDPQEAGKISGQCLARAGTTWTRTRRTKQVGCDEGGPARTE